MEEISSDLKIDRGLKLIASSSLIFFIGVFLSKLLNYIYRIVIARSFGPEVFGLFSLALMISGLFIALSSIGLSEGLTRYISLFRGKKEHNKISYLFKFTLSIVLFTGIIAGIFLFAFSRFIAINLFHNNDLTIFLQIFGLIVPLSILYEVFRSLIKAFEKMSWYSFIENVLQHIIKLISLFILIYLGFSTNAIAFSYLIGILATLSVSYLVVKKILNANQKGPLNDSAKRSLRKEFINYSWPIMFFGLLNTVFVMTDSFLIGYLKDVTQVGIYNIAISIATLIWFVPMIFTQLFLPIITKEYARKDINVIKELSKQLGKWIFIFNLPVFLIIFIFPGAIINILFGSQYLVAENSLRILAIGAFIASLGNSIAPNLIYMTGKSRIVLYNLIIFSLVNFILNLILIPMFGINGAAFSTTIAHALLSTSLTIGAYRLTSIIPLRKKILRIAIVSLIPTALLIYLSSFPATKLNLILFGLLFLLLYTLLLFITRCLDKNDFLIIKTIKKRLHRIS